MPALLDAFVGTASTALSMVCLDNVFFCATGPTILEAYLPGISLVATACSTVGVLVSSTRGAFVANPTGAAVAFRRFAYVGPLARLSRVIPSARASPAISNHPILGVRLAYRHDHKNS